MTGSSYLNSTGTAAGTVTVKWDPVYGSDYFSATLNGTASSTGYLSVVFSVTLSSAVVWHNAAGLGVMAGGTWAVAGGNPLSEGDVLAACSYSFEGTINHSGTPTGFLDVAFYLTAAPSGVPLPGAAGLAAIGLVGLSRRRRR